MNPDYWGVSICTIDGQRFSIGDVNVPFTLQSCSKPLTYAIALEKLGQEVVCIQYLEQFKQKSPVNNSEHKINLIGSSVRRTRAKRKKFQ